MVFFPNLGPCLIGHTYKATQMDYKFPNFSPGFGLTKKYILVITEILEKKKRKLKSCVCPSQKVNHRIEHHVEFWFCLYLGNPDIGISRELDT